VIITESIS